MSKKPDPELAEFEAALLRSFDDAINGRYARIHTPEEIVARRRGRPLGSKAETRKVSTTIRYDEEVIQAFKATGRGWQTRINDALVDWLRTHQAG